MRWRPRARASGRGRRVGKARRRWNRRRADPTCAPRGTARGRRFDLEVLNKSAIVLITSYWEAYCEDIAAEALDHAQAEDQMPGP